MLTNTRPSKDCWRLALPLAALLFASTTAAAIVHDLYAITVPVVDHSLETRPDAYAAALARVLVRTSGLRSVASTPAAASLLEQAERFVQQFTYTSETKMWVAFDGPALERALRDAGLPVWGRDRPTILVWLVVDSGNGRRSLLGSADEGAARQMVKAYADDRGLSLIWPLLDSEDLARATATDIWGGFGEKVRLASQRYGADAVLVARLRSGSRQRLYGTWDFETGSGNQRWQGGVADGMHSVADFLVSRLGSGVGDDGTAIVAVSGITSLTGYSDTLGYLERLSLIQSVDVIEARQDVVLFEVRLRGDPERLRRAIRLGRVLAPGPGDDGISLSFQYAR